MRHGNEPKRCAVGLCSQRGWVLPHFRLFHSEDIKPLLRLASLQASRTDLILYNSDLMASSTNAERKHLDSLQEIISFGGSWGPTWVKGFSASVSNPETRWEVCCEVRQEGHRTSKILPLHSSQNLAIRLFRKHQGKRNSVKGFVVF